MLAACLVSDVGAVASSLDIHTASHSGLGLGFPGCLPSLPGTALAFRAHEEQRSPGGTLTRVSSTPVP